MWPPTTATPATTALTKTTSRPGVDNSPLHAPVSDASQQYGDEWRLRLWREQRLPDLTFNATNYWVDVVLQAGPGADTDFDSGNACQSDA